MSSTRSLSFILYAIFNSLQNKIPLRITKVIIKNKQNNNAPKERQRKQRFALYKIKQLCDLQKDKREINSPVNKCAQCKSIIRRLRNKP